MQKNKHKSNASFMILAPALAVVLFIGAGISATEKDITQGESSESTTNPNREEQKKTKNRNIPDIFVPTDEVSADQAVAFPTDI